MKKFFEAPALKVQIQGGKMYSESARFYDVIYKAMKDFRKEADLINNLISDRLPDCRSILDVACGTGEHAKYLAEEHGYQIEGIDLLEEFVAISKEKCPQGEFTNADMRDFNLKKFFDVVLCMFSAIGYVKTLEGLDSAVKCMAKHLRPGGLLFIDPWFEPGVLQENKIGVSTADIDGGKIVRMSRCTIQGNLSTINFSYLIGNESGVTHKSEIHELGLFSKDEMFSVLECCNLTIEYDPQGPSNRGLYIGKKK